MARVDDIPEPTRSAILALDVPPADSRPFVAGPPLAARRVDVAGLVDAVYTLEDAAAAIAHAGRAGTLKVLLRPERAGTGVERGVRLR